MPHGPGPLIMAQVGFQRLRFGGRHILPTLLAQPAMHVRQAGDKPVRIYSLRHLGIYRRLQDPGIPCLRNGFRPLSFCKLLSLIGFQGGCLIGFPSLLESIFFFGPFYSVFSVTSRGYRGCNPIEVTGGVTLG